MPLYKCVALGMMLVYMLTIDILAFWLYQTTDTFRKNKCENNSKRQKTLSLRIKRYT